MRFTPAPDLAAIVRPAVIWLDGATVVDREARMNAPIAATEAAIRHSPPDSDAGSGSEVGSGLSRTIAAVRTMYKRVGIDPTKTRPSSEALLRRVRKGALFPRINSMVDVCNWCSLEFQLPYGLYDAARIEGDVELRIGRDGEVYAGIRKDDVHVGGRICLADDRGPFGNPTSDSARTMVTPATTSGMLVVFSPREVDRARLAAVLDATSARMTEFTGCRETTRWLEP
jgi:DNA/RNA-binding domain of Phe-tRNA-synthetase-like protein